MKLTLFDLDHTLLPIDSDYSWGVFTTTIGWTDPDAFQRQNDLFYTQYKAGTLDIAEYVRFATDAIRTRGATQSIAAHADFMRTVIEKELKPVALELVKRHQDAGDTVVIVTANRSVPGTVRPMESGAPSRRMAARERWNGRACGSTSHPAKGANLP